MATGKVRHPGPRCAVCLEMELRGEEWAAKLRGLLANPRYSYQRLARKLREDPDEPNLSGFVLGWHARGDCAAGEVLR